MASTNKTANYNLSQYIGSDKPTYLGDYNADMLAIDTGMATNKTKADNAVSVANAANQTAGNAQTTATQAQQTANSAKDTADGLSEAITQLTTKTNQNTSSITELINKFNLNRYNNVVATVTAGGGSTSENSLTVASNEDSSLFKIYGELIVNGIAWSKQSIKLTNTGLSGPSEPYTIKGIAFAKGQTQTDYRVLSATVNTDGSITFDRSMEENTVIRLWFPPCLYFNKNFNDSIIED